MGLAPAYNLLQTATYVVKMATAFFGGIVSNIPTSVRLPADLKAWIEARTILTDRSTSAAIVAVLRDVMDNDPLTALRVGQYRGRYVIASAYTGETFGTFAMKGVAEHQARTVLTMIGADPDNIIDETAKGAA
jgi:hypothetical protein